MSVKTAAQENVDSTIKNVNDAISDLNKIVVEQCWGTDEFKDTFRNDLKQSFHELIEIRDRLQKWMT